MTSKHSHNAPESRGGTINILIRLQHTYIYRSMYMLLCIVFTAQLYIEAKEDEDLQTRHEAEDTHEEAKEMDGIGKKTLLRIEKTVQYSHYFMVNLIVFIIYPNTELYRSLECPNNMSVTMIYACACAMVYNMYGSTLSDPVMHAVYATSILLLHNTLKGDKEIKYQKRYKTYHHGMSQIKLLCICITAGGTSAMLFIIANALGILYMPGALTELTWCGVTLMHLVITATIGATEACLTRVSYHIICIIYTIIEDIINAAVYTKYIITLPALLKWGSYINLMYIERTEEATTYIMMLIITSNSVAGRRLKRHLYKIMSI